MGGFRCFSCKEQGRLSVSLCLYIGLYYYLLVVYSLVTHLSKALYALQYLYGMVLHILSLVCQKCNSPLRVKQGGV